MKPDPVEKWFVKGDYPESTESLYRLGLKHYCELIGKTPEELKEEAVYEENQIPRMADRNIDFYLPQFRKHLKDSGKAPQTIKVYLSAAKSFYKYNGIQVPDVTTKGNDLCLEKNEGRLLKREEIQKMIEISPIRDKTIIYLMALTGMSQAEMRNLTIRKILDATSVALNEKIDTVEELFKNEEKLNDVILSLLITRKKVHYRYHTFIPPEVSRNIIYYLKERSYGRNEKIRISNINKELFVNHDGEPLTKHNVSSNFNRIGKKLGFKTNEKGAYAFWRSHGLRKYFISTIINKTGDHVLADYLVGHKIDRNKQAYWKADPEELKKRYLDVLEFLSIDEISVKDYTSEEYTKIKKEMKEMKEKDLKRQSELNEKDLKIQSLEATVNELTGRMDDVESNIELKSDEDVEVIKNFINKVGKRLKENPDDFNHITDAEWDELKKQIEK
ncbi:site-specific integrase [Methanobacterium sp. BAmetb5]|uniref:tyrosine-type recombinase/integrase n=1 Tax=Methanobacterium sp. BAmetb5 TaxID=2025351 RepID=UPI000E974D98|nr:site-specific integrase [Methanobacterium sp. BAmetb5]AXV40403.1 MAG: integrase [Methanobacterium sp. BAmetb5]